MHAQQSCHERTLEWCAYHNPGQLMKVLMISDVYFPRINGVSTSIETFRQALAAEGVHSTLIAPAYPGQTDSDEAKNIVRIPSRYLPMDPEDRLMRGAALTEWLKDNADADYDLVHIQTPFAAHYAGLKIARALDIPAIASYHTYFEEYLHHYIPFLPRSLMRSLARRFSRSQCEALDAVVVPSHAMADTLREYGVSRPQHIIPTGLRPEHFARGDGKSFRQRNQIENDRPLLLFVGRVAFEKNIGFLLDVVEEVRRSLPQVLLLITGEGPALDGLRRETSRRALSHNVRFLGYLDRKHELADCYQASDLFVFSSRTETQGLVLLEAMAQGKPVVALSAMGTRDILEGTPGTVIAQDEVADFSRHVRALLQDRPRLVRLGEEARSSAEKWSAQEMAARVHALYRSLCGQHADQAPEQAASSDIQHAAEASV